MDVFLQLEDVWSLDQSFDYTPLGDNDVTGAQCGLPAICTKSETLADTPMEELLELYSSPSEGSFGAEWMEQADFVFPDDISILSLPLGLEDDFSFKPSNTVPPTTTTTGSSSAAECKEELESLGNVFADEFLHKLHKESSMKLDTPQASPLSPQEEVVPEIVLDGNAEHSALQVLNSGTIEFIQSPLSPDDVESVLSSADSLSTSPAPSPSPSSASTVDASVLQSDSGSWSFNSSELYKVVENTVKSRPTPYSRPQKAPKPSKSKGRKQTASISPDPTELELELMSKKDRKKLQNKNAAIRYRMKKKQESDEKRTEVQDLEAVNISLREKCDELQREVQCMRGLINDIRKARGQPPLSQNSLLEHSK